MYATTLNAREVSPELRALNQSFATASFSPEGEVIRANAAFTALVGMDLPALLGRDQRDLLLDYDGIDFDRWSSLQAGEPRLDRLRILVASGGEVWIEARFVPILEEGGTVSEIVAIVRDISTEVLEEADEHGQIQAINASQGVVHLALDGMILDANTQFLDTMGYSAAEVIGRHHSLFVDPDHAASACYADFWEALASGAYRQGEFRRRAKDGRELWLQATYNPIFDAAGRPFKVVKYATDVTAERLRMADFQWQVAAIHKSHAVISFDMHGDILDVNDAFLRAVGYSREEVVGRHHRIFVDPAYAHGAEYAEFWRGLGRGHHQTGQYRRVDKQGREIWVQASYNPIFDIDGRPFKIVKYATVITDEKLRQAEHQGQIAAIHKAQCVIAFDLEGRVVDANDNFLDTMGYRLADVRGRHHRMFVDPGHRESDEYASFWADLRAGRHKSGEYHRVTADGRDVWLQASYSPIFDLAGVPIKIVKYAYDITEERTRQADYESQIRAIHKAKAVVSFTPDGVILDANENFEATMGYPVDELRGRHHSFLMDPGEAKAAGYLEFWDKLRAGEFINTRCRRMGKDGRQVWLQATYNPVFDLLGRLCKIVKFASDVSADVAMAEAFEDARRQAMHDPVTSLPSRARMTNFLAAELGQRSAEMVLLYCCLNRFRVIGETFGQQSADHILGEVANRIRRTLKADQMAARVGPDEFMIAAPNMNADQAEAMAQTLIAAVSEPIFPENGELRLTLSIGIALSPSDGDSPDDLIRSADTAMRQVGDDNRGGFRFFASAMQEQILAHRKLVDEIRRGMDAGEFFLEFQPRFDPRNQTIRSAEALIRWNHPERGRVSPAAFIPAAERSGLILPMGEWTMREACRTAAQWGDIGVSVNVSPVQFRDDGLVDMVRSALADAGLPAHRLELEVTEGVLVEDAARARLLLDGLKALGVTLAIDDFGTGYASLSYLRDYPFDVIKIDRQFINDIDSREGGRAVVQAILGLGKALGLSVTAEGVETTGQLASLIRDQCSEVQGYLLARPMAAAKVADMVAEHGVATGHGARPPATIDLDNQRQTKRNRSGKRS